MNGIVNYVKAHKCRMAMYGIFAAVFIVTLIQNLHVQFISDDWCYMFVYDHMGNPTETSRRVKTIFDVIVSMANHWRICNGRIVAHGLLQMVLATSYPGFHKIIFNVVNSAMYVLLGALIYRHASYKKRESAALLAGIYAMMWFFLPQYGATVLWASGAANYLWCSVIILAYLLPYRKYAGENVMANSAGNAILMGFFGLFAGCTNENSGGALALMCILFVIYYKIAGIKIPKWSVSGIAGTIIGAAVLIAAPGNYRISSKADFAELISRLRDVIDISKDLLFGLLIILCIVLFLAWITKNADTAQQNRGFTVLRPLIYIIGAAASVGVLIFAAMHPERTWFISVCLIISAIGYIFTDIDFSPLPVRAAAVGTAVIIAVCAVSYGMEFKTLSATYEQTARQADIIERALKEGTGEIDVNIVSPSKSRYDVMNYVQDFSPDGAEWQNEWASRYFGLDKITGISD